MSSVAEAGPTSDLSEATDSSNGAPLLHSMLDDTPPVIVNACGNYLTTQGGNKIFDACGGAAVASIGHGNARVCAAVHDQITAVDYCFSGFFTVSASEQLAAMLVEGTAGQMSKVFITSSGSEAVEAALKAARQYFVEGPNPQPQRHRFIARRQSYHGNTLGSLSISHHKIRKLVYEPLTTTNVSHVSACYPYRGQNDNETDEQYVGRLAQELEDEFQRVGPQTVCGFIVETVSGSTLGVVPPPPGYLKAMKDVCDKHGALFILDEVFCGMGRTGRLHAWETEGVIPHLQTVAKALGGGYQPISALLMHSSVADKIKMGSKFYLHSQTYQAHPVACAAAYEVQKIVQEEGLITNARCMGDYLGSLLKSRLGSHKHVGEVRGRGLMWGIELVEDKDLKTPFPPEKGVSFNIYQTGLKPGYDVMVFPCPGVYEGDSGDAILLTPAFNISREDVELIVDRVARTIEHVLGA